MTLRLLGYLKPNANPKLGLIDADCIFATERRFQKYNFKHEGISEPGALLSPTKETKSKSPSIVYISVEYICNILVPGADPGFFKGGGA